MIDFHCHLDLYPDPAYIAKGCAERGVYVLSVTTTPSAWFGTNALSQGRIRTALGLHPQIAHERKTELGLFNDLLPKVRYVGEIGLDASRELHLHWDDQLTVFNYILKACSKAGGRIMSVHSRHASKAVLDCLEANPHAGTPVLHWFSGSISDLDRAVAMGCWFSINPVMLSSSKGKLLVARMPKKRVLPESDGPFTQHNDKVLLPWNTDIVSKELSILWGVESRTIDDMLINNLKELVVNAYSNESA